MSVDQQLQELRRLTQVSGWSGVVAWTLKRNASPIAKDLFETYWIEAGHRIREQLGDDHLLASFLWLALPLYAAPAGTKLELFRGENLDRLRAGRLGFAWTPDRSAAEMFASGLNAEGRGGVLLRALVGAEVIAGPCEHSRYLGENQYTVDPTGKLKIEEVAQFPPIS
jgi:hypothetical protein